MKNIDRETSLGMVYVMRTYGNLEGGLRLENGGTVWNVGNAGLVHVLQLE